MTSTAPAVILASTSPARARLLKNALIPFQVQPSSVDEESELARHIEVHGKPSSADEALFLATLKAEAVASGTAGALVIGCDSVFEIEGVSYGKPYTIDETVRRWSLMSGKTGILHTGQVVIDTRTNSHRSSRIVSTEVRFANVTPEEALAYAQTGEPLQCAGAFTLDGRGSTFVAGILGDANAVIGISTAALREQFLELGYSVPLMTL